MDKGVGGWGGGPFLQKGFFLTALYKSVKKRSINAGIGSQQGPMLPAGGLRRLPPLSPKTKSSAGYGVSMYNLHYHIDLCRDGRVELPVEKGNKVGKVSFTGSREHVPSRYLSYTN